MLTVPTYVATSPKKGLGLFAEQKIKRGTKYWVRNEKFDEIISWSEYKALPTKQAIDINTYGFLEVSHNWYLCKDNANYTNHSAFGNVRPEFDENGIILFLFASRDIEKGEEILCDYTELCLTCRDGIKHFKVIESMQSVLAF